MSQTITRMRSDEVLAYRDLYREAGQPWPASARQIAIWAINHGHYVPSRAKLLTLAAEEISKAMGHEYFTDDQGRRVRIMHCARVVQKGTSGEKQQAVLWDDIRTAGRSFMERAFQQRRRQIVAECKQLKNDVDGWNHSRPLERPIQLELDFSADVSPESLPEDYRPNWPR